MPTRAHRPRRPLWTPIAALVLAALPALDGCAAPTRAAASAQAPLDPALPTLEEIFYLPGPQGEAPTSAALSGDGRWLLFRWRPLARDEKGERKFASESALRLVATSGADTTGRGVQLASLLPAPESTVDPKPGAQGGELEFEWSHQGHRLAVARGAQVWMLDTSAPDAWQARLVFSDPGEAAAEKPADPPEGAIAPPGAPRLGRVRNLSFSDDDRELEIDDGKEIYALALAAPGEERAPAVLADLRCLTSAFEPACASLTFDRARTIAFNQKGAFALAAAADAPPAEPAGEAPAPEPAKAQIFRASDGRAVVLEGMAEIKNLETVSLSPDGNWVIGSEVDRSSEPPANLVPDYLTQRVSTRETRRERAEDLEPVRKLYVWDTDTGARTELVLPGEALRNVRTAGWSRAKDGPMRFAFARVSEDWRTYELWLWSPEDGLRLLLTDRDERWYGGPSAGARWSGDGRALIYGSESTPQSTTPGRCQLFAVSPETGAMRQLTSAAGEVSEYASRPDGSLVYCASALDPGRRFLGFVNGAMVRGESGGAAHELATPVGNHARPVPAATGDAVVFAHETLGVPAELWFATLSGAEKPRQVTRTLSEEYAARDWIRPETLKATGADGVPVYAHVYMPRSSTLARPDRARPCVVFIHGAGYLQNVCDSMTEYEPNLMFHSRLADEGFVVVDVDYRGSAGYGSRFRTDVQYHLGELELADIHTVLDALDARGAIDPARLGCYGGSYGGFLVLMALFTEPGRWKCGAALRSVTDWRTYHPGYTQPRLGRPSTHPEAYARSSPIDHAAGLQDRLLLLHGMVDTNVFAQDSIRLMEVLIDQGKDFDVMLYPSQDHAFSDGHHWVDEYRRIERLMRATLLDGDGVAP